MANKQLIVDSQFSIVSAIWEPHAPETIYSGTLTADENDIRFTTAPHYVPVVLSWRELGERLSGKIGQTRFPVLHGFTEYGDCTLCECIEVARPGQNDMSRHKSITAVSYRSSIAVIGIPYRRHAGKVPGIGPVQLYRIDRLDSQGHDGRLATGSGGHHDSDGGPGIGDVLHC